MTNGLTQLQKRPPIHYWVKSDKTYISRERINRSCLVTFLGDNIGYLSCFLALFSISANLKSSYGTSLAIRKALVYS
jgi:hypothetical protein